MNEWMIRILIAQGTLVSMLVLEYFIPLRDTSRLRMTRWIQNFGLGFFNIILIRVTVGAIAYESAIYFQEHGFGLLNLIKLESSGSIYLAIGFSAVFLDLAIYFQHRISHIVPFLWRFHKVHHTDLEFDASLSVRFHPIEIVFSMGYKLFFIFILGAHPIGVVIFEVVLNAGSTFNHSNIRISKYLERILRFFIVTPDMHRIHHSINPLETNSNYSFSLSIWDRIFGSYREESQNPQKTMLIGIESYREDLNFLQILKIPFLNK